MSDAGPNPLQAVFDSLTQEQATIRQNAAAVRTQVASEQGLADADAAAIAAHQASQLGHAANVVSFGHAGDQLDAIAANIDGILTQFAAVLNQTAVPTTRVG